MAFATTNNIGNGSGMPFGGITSGGVIFGGSGSGYQNSSYYNSPEHSANIMEKLQENTVGLGNVPTGSFADNNGDDGNGANLMFFG